MQLSLRQAADHAGVSKSTILRAIQKGRLSATRNDDGGYCIDPAELNRVYPAQRAATPRTDATGQDAPALGPDATAENAALKAQIDGLNAQLALMREQVDDLKSQRDGWQSQAETALRRLENHSPRQNGFWGWLKRA